MTQPKARLGGEQYSGDNPQNNKASSISMGGEQYNTPQSQGQSQGNAQGQQAAQPTSQMDQYNKPLPAAGGKSDD